MTDLLAWTRAFHFAATVSVTGTVIFLLFIALPALKLAGDKGRGAEVLRLRLLMLAWISLAGVLITGFAWLVFLAQQMSDLPLKQVFAHRALSTLLTGTTFGLTWSIRFFLSVLLAGALYGLNGRARPPSKGGLVCAFVLAVALAGTLSNAGHAAATEGIAGILHLTSDFLHLVAASAWVGALIPLALLIQQTLKNPGADALAVAQTATRRFSLLGVLSVGTLVITGTINTAILVGSVPALFNTGYGRLLLLKIAFFLVMLGVAAVNRFRLTPRIMQSSPGAIQQALAQLRINCYVEVALGAIVLCIVAVLGTLPPGAGE